MEEEDHDEPNEYAHLFPRSYGGFALRVASADEATTVQRLSFATLALAGIYILHFLNHIANHGRLLQCLVHLFAAGVLPYYGYHAIKTRVAARVYAFHLMNVIAGLAHFFMVIYVISVLALKEDVDPEPNCSSLVSPAHLCPEHYAKTPKGTFSLDQRQWRCNSGFCIDAAGRCNGEVNCYDHSDEQNCGRRLQSEEDTKVWYPRRTEEATLERDQPMTREQCEQKYKEEQEYMAPALRHWWYFMSLPMLLLNIYIGYHSLEFYVQLRIRNFTARMNADSGTATVVVEGVEADTNTGFE